MTVPIILAHRGASGKAVENSLSAFQLASILGADGVELDVHTTRDGGIMVHHDPEVPGFGIITEATVKEVSEWTLSNGETVPTLEAALDVLGDLRVWIEIKSLSSDCDRALLAQIPSPSPANQYGLHSFDHRIVHRLAQAAPQFDYGLLSASYPVDPLYIFRDSPARFLWQAESLIDDALVGQAQSEGIGVIAWTVSDPNRARRLADAGVAGLCGNNPDQLRAAVS